MSVQTIQDHDLISRRSSIVAADTADEAILLDIDSGYFFQLNKSAARIWSLVEQPKSFSDLCSDLQTSFDVASGECREDVAGFVADLQDRGLLTVAGG